MKSKMWLSALVLLGLIVGAMVPKPLAQTAQDAPAEHQGMGAHHHEHSMDTSSDGAFHRHFNDADKWAKEFDDPERDAWQKPEEVLNALHLDRGARVADIGAGTGYFSVRIARHIPAGKVYAADIEPDMVRYLGERAQRERLPNLMPVQASAESANLPEAVDLILVVDTYHHIGDRTQYFTKLKSSLRPAGKLVIIDFTADSPTGPPAQYRVSREQVERELTPAGYSLVGTQAFLPRQNFFVLQKSDK